MKLLKLSLEAFGPYLKPQTLLFDHAHRNGLFLVQGPTGSGKSSILDALCFCLYGMPIGDKKELMEIRCHLSPDDVKTWVELEFELSGLRFRARRSFGIKKGQTGDHQCMLEAWNGQEWEAKYSRLTQANEAIAALLGLKSDQFRQVILLPQGKFRDFLIASSQDRTDILKTLFNTRDLDTFMNLLQSRLTRIRDETLSHQNRIQGLIKSLGLDRHEELEPLERSTRTALADLESQILVQKEKTEAARVLMQKSLEQEELGSRLSQLTQVLEKLEAQRPEMAALNQTIMLARKVAPLSERGAAVKNLKAELESLEREYTQAKNMVEEKQRQHQALEAQTKSMDDLKANAFSLHRSIAGLRQLLELQIPHEEKGAQADRSRSALERFRQESQEWQDKLNALSQTLSEARARLAMLEAPKADSPQDQPEARLSRLEVLAQQGADLEKQISTLTRDMDERNRELAADQKDLEAFRDEFRSLSSKKDDLVRHLKEDQAALLRKDLVEGQACPVCGATHHILENAVPKMLVAAPPATADNSVLEDLDSRIRQVEKQIQEREWKSASHHDRQREDTLRLEGLKNQLDQVAVAWKSMAVPLARELASTLDSAGLDHELGEAASYSLSWISHCRKALLDLTRHREELSTHCQAIQTEQGALSAQIAQIQGKADHEKATLEAALLALAELEKRIDQTRSTLTSGIAMGNSRETRQAIASLDAEAQHADESVRTFQADLGLAAQSLAHALQTLQDTATRLERTRSAGEEKEQSWLADLKAAGFMSVDEARKAFQKPEEIEKMAARLEGWEKNAIQTTTQVQELESRKDQNFTLAPTEARNTWNAYSAELGRLHQDQGKQAALLDRIIHTSQELDGERQKFREAEARLALHDGLYRVLNGQDSRYKINLERYALSVYLDEVLEEANHHLDRLSRGRYLLIRQEEGQDKRRSAGLDISIMDAYTGKARSSATLSGGESFMAALALALGLSAVVHRRSGGVRLDTLLIDEGFGSLDEEALQDAMAVLSLLKEKGQVVGIISHVKELQERIGCQLLVRRSPSGSSLAWAE